MSDNKQLAALVQTFPVGFSYTPIYREGAPLYGGKLANTGKMPLHSTRKEVWSPSRTAKALLELPHLYAAVGMWCGSHGNGLIVLDVDYQLAALEIEHGASLALAPKVTSTKPNAAKFLFKAPPGEFEKLAGYTLDRFKDGSEVLYQGKQAVICGHYPGKTDKETGEIYPEGEYTLHGDINDIPVAPEWLLERMRQSFADAEQAKRRPTRDASQEDETTRRAIVMESLSVLPPDEFQDYNAWLKIGMGIHAAELSDGLEIWEEWSKQDDTYAAKWKANPNMCADKWRSFNTGGGITIGTLVFQADRYDPHRNRCHRSTVTNECFGDDPVKEQLTPASFEMLMFAVRTTKQHPSAAFQRMSLNGLAAANGFRDPAELDNIYNTWELERSGINKKFSPQGKTSEQANFIIPGMLAAPSVVLLHGEGGLGKTTFALRLSAHVMAGESMLLRGQSVPIARGSVLYFSADQGLQDFDRQIEDMGLAPVFEANPGCFTVIPDWQFSQLQRFQALLIEHQPRLVILDSLTGLNGTSLVSENDARYAKPIRELTVLLGSGHLPRCAVIILHHNNKTGGFRGSTSIRDAVDETWAMKAGANPDQVLIEQGKSRRGLNFGEVVITTDDAGDVTITSRAPIGRADRGVDTTRQRVLRILQLNHPRAMTAADIEAAQASVPGTLLGGQPPTVGSVPIRTALVALRRTGQIEVVEKRKTAAGGTPQNVYRAVMG